MTAVTATAIAALVSSLLAGSFVALLADRVSNGLPFVADRSRCDGCGRTLSPAELVPLVSYAFLRGRARCCGALIPPRLAVTELAAVAVAAMAVLATTGPAVLAASLGLGWTLLALSLIDLRCLRLPYGLTLPLAGAGLALSAARLTGPFPDHLAGAVMGWSLVAGTAWAYRRLRGIDGIGMGDAALLGAAGAWLGWQALPSVMLLACAAGLTLALATPGGLHGRRAIPFGPALAFGFWVVWLWGPVVPA